ncbi:hypothetical protein GCM10009868_38330 [Terrabacter aerolatus]|uniref:DUF7144 domain-containing protein n=1 Tax=Terrabacter aerolatus TaxID=422442 RepID=A0A512D0P4_9MICO|nr:hypothetical protein [Terrabacter aerolatus]GEO30034.1 hypothetical protein TAE01_18440 [Terrabacter aerolatus]
MARSRPATGPRPAPARPVRETRRARTLLAAGASTFAATVMLVAGLFQFVEGLVTLVDGPTFLVRTPSYVFTFNATAWGWFHMVIGLGAAVAGPFIFTGNLVARSAGIALAVLSALANFLWLPSYPVWAIVVIALDVIVIWALSTVDLGEL